MKTHDLAKALTQLGKVLRALPNQDLESLSDVLSARPTAATGEVGINLSALAALSKYSKTDWELVAAEFALPIDSRSRDGARDVMGKILTYLAENESERERVAKQSRTSTSAAPSELSSALKFLLSNG